MRQALSLADDVLMQRARCIARRIEGSQQPTIFTWLLWPALCSARSCPTVKSGSFIGPVQLSYEMCVLVLLSVVLASTCKNEMWLKWILSMPYSKPVPMWMSPASSARGSWNFHFFFLRRVLKVVKELSRSRDCGVCDINFMSAIQITRTCEDAMNK